ncbi:MAG: hypothetical protein ACW967_04590 [Candidatus Hodarchaeales archaeon]|jgi:hypothetical protein
MLLNNFKEKVGEKLNICVIGNPTLDTIEIDKQIINSRGGAITFILPWIKNFIPDSNIHVYCSGPPNCLDHLSFLNNIITHIQLSKVLTEFRLLYNGQYRQLELMHEPQQISFEFFLANKPENEPNLIIICPIYNEIENEFVSKIKKHYPKSIISVQAQGFVRTKNENNRIIIKDWKPREAFFKAIDVFVISHEELTKKLFELMTKFKKINRIITLGSKGATILSGNSLSEDNVIFAAFPIRNDNKINPTGVGDVFFICTTLKFFLTGNMKNSIVFGNLMAKFHLENQIKDKNYLQNLIESKILEHYIDKNMSIDLYDQKSINNQELKKILSIKH